MLLYGPPGVGKTYLQVIAQESKMAFISVAGSSFFSMWLEKVKENKGNI